MSIGKRVWSAVRGIALLVVTFTAGLFIYNVADLIIKVFTNPTATSLLKTEFAVVGGVVEFFLVIGGIEVLMLALSHFKATIRREKELPVPVPVPPTLTIDPAAPQESNEPERDEIWCEICQDTMFLTNEEWEQHRQQHDEVAT